uniref:7TM_GPCR_Srx domain-containing protein n=1 Tax=Ascaris lumbricoides TaxID=6252 RepID=A0A0M3IQA5_ASCLU
MKHFINVDFQATRAAIYILIISAIFGVIPGTINGCAEYLNLMILNDVGFFIGVCASISGLSHAFIFGMAHRGVRSRILRMFGHKPLGNLLNSSALSAGLLFHE